MSQREVVPCRRPVDAGKTVHFVGRWQNTRGEHGPLSETVSATAPG
jgi:hypothetical protein